MRDLEREMIDELIDELNNIEIEIEDFQTQIRQHESRMIDIRKELYELGVDI